MLAGYIRVAMRWAAYVILSDGTFYGEIPGFQGVYADALENCREQLREVFEGGIVLGLRLGHALPVVEGMKLLVEKEAV